MGNKSDRERDDHNYTKSPTSDNEPSPAPFDGRKEDVSDLFPAGEFENKYVQYFHSKENSLPAQDVAKWLTEYLKNEEFNDPKTIQDDLHDEYSEIRNQMETDFQNKMNEHEVNEVFSFLKDEIFPIPDDDVIFGYGHSNLRLSSGNNLADIYEDAVGGDSGGSSRRSSAFHSPQKSMDPIAGMMLGDINKLTLTKLNVPKQQTIELPGADTLTRELSARDIAVEKRYEFHSAF